jgi:hypothetical protein
MRIKRNMAAVLHDKALTKGLAIQDNANMRGAVMRAAVSG